MVGKFVNVFFGRADALFNVRVRDLPHDVGDSWVLESEDGTVHHVIFFERMSECSPNSGESPPDSPASPVQHAQPAIRLLYERWIEEECSDTGQASDIEAFVAWADEQQAGAQ